MYKFLWFYINEFRFLLPSHWKGLLRLFVFSIHKHTKNKIYATYQMYICTSLVYRSIKNKHPVGVSVESMQSPTSYQWLSYSILQIQCIPFDMLYMHTEMLNHDWSCDRKLHVTVKSGYNSSSRDWCLKNYTSGPWSGLILVLERSHCWTLCVYVRAWVCACVCVFDKEVQQLARTGHKHCRLITMRFASNIEQFPVSFEKQFKKCLLRMFKQSETVKTKSFVQLNCSSIIAQFSFWCNFCYKMRNTAKIGKISACSWSRLFVISTNPY